MKSSELLKKLISIKSPSGMERQIQEFIEGFFAKIGIKLERQEVERDRFNLFFKGKGDVLISCHVDTVPPAGMKGAYRPVERDGRIYGRGASDVKGALASLMVAVETFVKESESTDLPLSLAFVVDEETNSALGSLKMAEVFKGEYRTLVLEPTYGRLCTAQMGALEFTLKVRCPSAHGSEFEKAENPVKVMWEILGTLERELSRKVNVIMLRGGSKLYAVPKECEALLEVKVLKGEDFRSLEEKIKQVLNTLPSGCSAQYRLEDGENFLDLRSEEFADQLEEIYLKANGERPQRGVMPSWTDAANYHRAGHRCVVFGHGSLIDSHTDRESISILELERMERFFLELLRSLS